MNVGWDPEKCSVESHSPHKAGQEWSTICRDKSCASALSSHRQSHYWIHDSPAPSLKTSAYVALTSPKESFVFQQAVKPGPQF